MWLLTGILAALVGVVSLALHCAREFFRALERICAHDD